MANGYIIETRDLSKEFRGFLAVSQVNLRVRRGSIHALIGPNGAGKTTVFNLVTKFLEPTRGQILYDGRDVTRAKPADLAREGMVRSFQISATFPHLTVLENVRIALQRRLGTSFHFWRSEGSLDVLPYGRKRALEIATTLALDPKLMLLDEPTAGMGHEDVGRVAELIRKVAQERTVLMVEHNLSVVADLSDVITVLQRGRILAEGSYDEVSNNPEVREAYMGTGHA